MSEGRRMRLTGLHHLTAICRDLERTTAFYRDLLGLQLIREGASDDDPDARHFWFSAGDGAPGTLISFLEYPDLEPGVVGVGSVQHFAFAVDSAEEQEAWRDYLRDRGAQATDVFERGGFRSIYLRDPDGHIVEIATRPSSPPAEPAPGASGEGAARPGSPAGPAHDASGEGSGASRPEPATRPGSPAGPAHGER